MTQKERQEHSRQEILRAALEEFGRRDYDAVNMEQICKNHGISKGMMYHYYSGKDELFLLCVRETFERLTAHVEAGMAQLGEGDALGSIQRFFLLRESYFQDHPERKRIFENAMLRPPEHLREEIWRLWEPLRRMNRAFLERMVRTMPLRPGLEPERVIRYLESTEASFRSLLLHYQEESEGKDLHTVLGVGAEMLDLILFGVLRQSADQV